jgi:spermidine synthase
MSIEKVKELIQMDNLDSKDRHRDLVYKRSYLYALLREDGWMTTKIGELFKRDHATVLNGLKNHYQYFGKDKIYDCTIREYVNVFCKVSIQLDDDRDTIYQDIMDCHNTTALGIIKQRIKDGYYDKP